MTALDDVTDRIDYALVGPRDSRRQVIATRRYPFSTVCHLGRDFGDGRLRGCSGVLVGPRLVLTAAHCLYSLSKRRGPRRIVVTPARRDRDTAPFGRIVARRFAVPSQFVQPQDRAGRKPHDYGLIMLPRPFPGLRRFMPVVAASSDLLRRIARRGLVGVAGYPGDRPTGTMWYHRERLERSTSRRLYYTVDTCPGHSGSPVFVGTTGSPRVMLIGVHTSGIIDRQGRSYGCSKGSVLAPPGMFNSGVRITPSIAAMIRRPTAANLAAGGMIAPGQ